MWLLIWRWSRTTCSVAPWSTAASSLVRWSCVVAAELAWWTIARLALWMIWRGVCSWLRCPIVALLIRHGLWWLLVRVILLLCVLIDWRRTLIEIGARCVSSCCLFWWPLLLIIIFRVSFGLIVPLGLILDRRRNRSYLNNQ